MAMWCAVYDMSRWLPAIRYHQMFCHWYTACGLCANSGWLSVGVGSDVGRSFQRSPWTRSYWSRGVSACTLALRSARRRYRHWQVATNWQSALFNPLTPTVAIWVPLLHPVSDRVKLSFEIFDIRELWSSAMSVRVHGCQKWQMTV